jgi:hypothetical protein
VVAIWVRCGTRWTGSACELRLLPLGYVQGGQVALDDVAVVLSLSLSSGMGLR